MKIILLVREPIDRAWSHLKHTIVYREANFASYPPDAAVTVSLNELVQNLVHDFTLSSGDYESIILRWMAHFPPSQFHIAFFEEATARPEQYFASLFRFLGADPIISFKDFPLDKKENAARLPWEMPSELTPWLGRLHRVRRKRIKRLLQSTFGLTVPWPGLAAEQDHADPLRLPDLPSTPKGWVVELGEGWFRGRPVRSANSGASHIPNRPRSTRRTAFVGDLLDHLKPDHARSYDVLRRAGWSVEDRRLARELDAIARSAS